MKQGEKMTDKQINYDSLQKILQSDYAERAKKYIDSLYDYGNYVMRMNLEALALRNIEDGEEYRRAVESLDKQRKIKHDSAISALSVLNNIAKRAGIAPVITPDVSELSRGDIAFAIFEMCKYCLDNDKYGANNKS